MKNALDMLVNTLDMAKQIISELEKMSVEISKPDCKEKKDEKDLRSRNYRKFSKDTIFTHNNGKKERKTNRYTLYI